MFAISATSLYRQEVKVYTKQLNVNAVAPDMAGLFTKSAEIPSPRYRMKNESVKIRKIGEHWDGQEKVWIWLVDGKKIRDHMYQDFTQGNHHYRFNQIPENEVWIDDSNHPERQAIVEHECHERKLMKFKKMSYSAAHDRANRVEKKVRAELKPRRARIKIGDVITDGLVNGTVIGDGLAKMGKEDVPAYKIKINTGHEKGKVSLIFKDHVKSIVRRRNPEQEFDTYEPRWQEYNYIWHEGPPIIKDRSIVTGVPVKFSECPDLEFFIFTDAKLGKKLFAVVEKTSGVWIGWCQSCWIVIPRIRIYSLQSSPGSKATQKKR